MTISYRFMVWGRTLSVAALLFAALSGIQAAQPEWYGRLDAPMWPDVKPMYYDHARDPACFMVGAYFNGKFISAVDDTAAHRRKGTKFLLRKKFCLETAPSEAWLQGTADTRATFKINGREAMKGWYSYLSAQNRTFTADVGKLLKAGDNELKVEYTVDATCDNVRRTFPGGVLLELFASFPDGSFKRIDSDGSFESSIDGETWKGVVLSDPPPSPPRISRLAYCDFANPQELLENETASVCVKAGDRTSLRYVFRGNVPRDAFTVRLELRRGKSLYWEEEIPLTRSNVERMKDGCWRLTIPFEAPHYIHPGEYTISLESNSIYCRRGGKMGGTVKILSTDLRDTFTRPVAVDVRKVAGRPVVHIDGEPFPLMWGAVARNRRPDRMPRHSEMPLNAVTVYAHCDKWHPSAGVYDFSEFDCAAEKCRRTNPDAWFIWDLSVYPPRDFARRHPDQMSADDEGDITPIGRFSWSYASRTAMDEIKEMTERAIRYIEVSPYANRVIGYRVNSGVTIEWLGWTARSGRVKDFSQPNKEAFAHFAASRYPELAKPHVPSKEERQVLDAPNDILWDRARHLNAIAYTEYSSWIIAQDILEVCGHAKDVLKSLGRTKMVGTFYGYTYFLNSTGCDTWRGHFALSEILENNAGRIDFLMSPQSYSQRRLGDVCGEMKPFSSIAAAGVLPVIENDARTHNRFYPRSHGYHQTITAEQTEGILRRDMSVALCRCCPPYLYALASGVDLNSPECSAAGRDIHTVQRFCIERNTGRHAEVAFVASEKSICAMPDLSGFPKAETGRWMQSYRSDGTVSREAEKVAVFNGEVFGLAHTRFARAGVPVDYLLAEDIKNRPGNYKLYVFLNLFTYDVETLAAVKNLRARGATILWLYAPGWLNRRSLDDMESLTGIAFASMSGQTLAGVTVKSDGRYMGMPSVKVAQMFYPVRPDEVLGVYEDGRPGLTVSKTGNSLSFFSGTWQLDVPYIRTLAERAGVHIWCDTDDPIEANDCLFTLHARSSGLKTVHLPRKATVVDVFAKRIMVRDAEVFTFDAKLHSSYLFYFGADAEKLVSELRSRRDARPYHAKR